MAQTSKYSPKSRSAAEGDQNQFFSSSSAAASTTTRPSTGSTPSAQQSPPMSSAMKASERRRARHAAYSNAPEKFSSPTNTHSSRGAPVGGSSNSGNDAANTNEAFDGGRRSTGSGLVEGNNSGTGRSGGIAAVHSAIGAVSPPSSSSSGGDLLATSVAAELGVSSQRKANPSTATPKHRSGALDRARARSARRHGGSAKAGGAAAAASNSTAAERDNLPALELRVPSSFSADTVTSDSSMISGLTGFTASYATPGSYTPSQVQTSPSANRQRSVGTGTPEAPSLSLFRVAAQSSGSSGISGGPSRSEGGINLSVRRTGKKAFAEKTVPISPNRGSGAETAPATGTDAAEQPPILPSASREDMASTIASVIGHTSPSASASPSRDAFTSSAGVTPKELGMPSPSAAAHVAQHITMTPQPDSHMSPKPSAHVPTSPKTPSSAASPFGKSSMMDVLRSATSSKASPDAEIGGVPRESKPPQHQPRQLQQQQHTSRSIAQREPKQGDVSPSAKATKHQDSSPLQFMRSATASKASPDGVVQRPTGTLSPHSSPLPTSRPAGTAVPAMATQMVAQAVHRDPKSSGGRSPPRSPQQEFLMNAFASSILDPGGPKLPNLHSKEATEPISPTGKDTRAAGMLLARKRQEDIHPGVSEGIEVDLTTGAASDNRKVPVSSSSYLSEGRGVDTELRNNMENFSDALNSGPSQRDNAEGSMGVKDSTPAVEDAAAAIDEIRSRSFDTVPEHSSDIDDVKGRSVNPSAIASIRTFIDSGNDGKLGPSADVVAAAKRDAAAFAKKRNPDNAEVEAPESEAVKDETSREDEAAEDNCDSTAAPISTAKAEQEAGNTDVARRESDISSKHQEPGTVGDNRFVIDGDAFVLNLDAIAKAENDALRTIENLEEAKDIGGVLSKEDPEGIALSSDQKVSDSTKDAGKPSLPVAPDTANAAAAPAVDESGNDNAIVEASDSDVEKFPSYTVATAAVGDDNKTEPKDMSDTEAAAVHRAETPTVDDEARSADESKSEHSDRAGEEKGHTESSKSEPTPPTPTSIDASQPIATVGVSQCSADDEGNSNWFPSNEPSERNEHSEGNESTATRAIEVYIRRHAPAEGLSPNDATILETYTNKAAKLVDSKVPIKDAAKQILRSSRKDGVPDQVIIRIFQSLKAVEDFTSSKADVDMEEDTPTEYVSPEDKATKNQQSQSNESKTDMGNQESLSTEDGNTGGQQSQLNDSKTEAVKHESTPADSFTTEDSTAEKNADKHESKPPKSLPPENPKAEDENETTEEDIQAQQPKSNGPVAKAAGDSSSVDTNGSTAKREGGEEEHRAIENVSSEESLDMYGRTAEPETYDSDISDIPRRQTVAEMRSVNDGDMEVYLMEEEVVEVAYVDEEEEMRATEKSRNKVKKELSEDIERNNMTNANVLDSSETAPDQATSGEYNKCEQLLSSAPPLAAHVEPMSELEPMARKRDRLIMGERVLQEVDPGHLGGVAAAAAIARRSPRKKFASRRRHDVRRSRRPVWHQSYEERTRGHTGYFSVDFYSLSDSTAMVNQASHRLDDVPWEHRSVKQRFLFEKSISFSRNWFGSANPTRGNSRNFEPVCHPRSLLMQMERLPNPGEWREEWYASWKSRKENPNALVADKVGRRVEIPSIPANARAPSQSKEGAAVRDKYAFEDDAASLSDVDEDVGKRNDGASWEEPPEVGTLCTVRYKAGEPKSRVNWFLTSRLRKSRWRKKYLPPNYL